MPISLLFWGAVVLSGCQSSPPEPPPAPIVVDKSWLYPRLDAADEAIKQMHLAYPEQDSALSIYQEILARYPNQEDAQRGIERIVEEYVKLALQASEGRQFQRARSMLSEAQRIAPEHPSISPTQAQVELLSRAVIESINISQDNLRGNDAQTNRALEQLGEGLVGYRCRYTIRAINDAQGRKIYAALSRGSQDAKRIAAQVKIQLPAGVERVCFDTTRSS